MVLLPLLGPFLALRFIVDHFRIARWPLLCQLGGYVFWIGGALSHAPR